jgi:hypothetical protein
MNYASPQITLHAPMQREGKWALAADIELPTGDVAKLEAHVTPETLDRMSRMGMRAVRGLARWARNNVRLRGDWEPYGLAGKVAAGVVAETARHPLMNLPMLGSEDDKSHPAYQQALELLAGDGYPTFDRLRAMAVMPRCKPDYRALMAACCHLGNCCCGKKVVRGCYDVSYLLDHPWAAPADSVAIAMTDAQALRSYRSIFDR